ncbi:MAG: hypothetical protein JXR72_08495 [Proteobacteria bacterium]|nr:hypothetical protein [Pseudomonadota bacterium]
MKKYGVSLLVVFMALGLVVMFSGCGDDGDDGLPKSDAAYAGSNEPAYIGTENGASYDFDLEMISALLGLSEHEPPFGPWDVWDVFPDAAEGSESEDYSYSNQGSGGGLFEAAYTWDAKGDESEYSENEIFKATFSDYADSGDVPPYVMEGDGALYWKNEESGIFTEYGPREVGSLADGFGYPLPEVLSGYVNYADLSFIGAWDPDYTDSYAGWLSGTHTRDWETGLCDSVMKGDFSYSWATSTYQYYRGLLDSEMNMAFDGTDTKIMGSGRYCNEGNVQLISPIGCVNFDIDVVFEDDQICFIQEYLNGVKQVSLPFYFGYPDSGTVKVDNRESEADTQYSTAMYDYGDTDGPDTFKYLLDAESDGSYEYSTYLEKDVF